MKTYRKYEALPSCRLTKADLVLLIRMITAHAVNADAVSIQTVIGNATIKASTLDAFLSHDDLPPVLDNLRVWGGSESRSITLELGGSLSSLSIVSEDEVWMRGSYDRLHELLQRCRRFAPPPILGSTVTVSIAISGVLTVVVQLLVQGQLLYGFLASVTGTFLLLRYVSWAFIGKAKLSQIILVEKATLWDGVLTRDNLAMLIAVVGLVFTIIQTFK